MNLYLNKEFNMDKKKSNKKEKKLDELVSSQTISQINNTIEKEISLAFKKIDLTKVINRYIDELIKKPNLDKQLIKVLDHYISEGDFDQWGGSVNILDEYLDSKEFKNKFRLRIADYIDAPEVFKEIVDNKEFHENLREELLDQALRRVSDEESYNFDIDIKISKKKIKTNY